VILIIIAVSLKFGTLSYYYMYNQILKKQISV